MVRVFRENGRDGLSYLTQQSIKYVPIGDVIELNLGTDPEVVFELVKLRVFRDHVWMRDEGTGQYRRVDDGVEVIERRSSVAGWDDHTIYGQRIRNYTNKPIDVQVRRSLDGHVVFRSSLDPKLHDYHTVEYSAAIKPGEKADLRYEVVQRQGYSAKQNNVTLESAKVNR
jgi:hypothetical protein